MRRRRGRGERKEERKFRVEKKEKERRGEERREEKTREDKDYRSREEWRGKGERR